MVIITQTVVHTFILVQTEGFSFNLAELENGLSWDKHSKRQHISFK